MRHLEGARHLCRFNAQSRSGLWIPAADSFPRRSGVNAALHHSITRSSINQFLQHWPRIVRRFALTAPLLLAAGCSFLKPARSTNHVYLLTPASVSSAAVPTHALNTNRVVRIRPIDLADYLRTKEIPVRTGTNEIEFSVFHQWAELLDAGVQRVLAEDLRGSVEIEGLLADPAPRSDAKSYTLSVRILACEGVRAGNQRAARFAALWQLAGPDGAVERGEFIMKPAPWNGENYDQLVGDLSQGVNEFAKVLLDALSRRDLSVGMDGATGIWSAPAER